MPYYETIHDRIADIRKHLLFSDSPNAALPAPLESMLQKACAKSGQPGILTADRNRLMSADFQILLYVYDHSGIEWSVSPFGIRRVQRQLPRRGWYHKHEYVEILYVIDGSFDQLLLGERYHFLQGSFVITDQNCEHSD